jgi:predicted TPR repeat methyltransferase
MEQSSSAPREITVDEAMAIAIRCQQNEQLDEAAMLLRKVLEIVPDSPNALHFSGVLAHQQGRSVEALSLIARSLEVDPRQADWHSNFGVVLQSTGRLDEAISAYRQAIALEPRHTNAYNNLGVLLRAQGHLAESEESYRAAIALDPDQPDPHHNLAVLLSVTGRAEEAVKCFCRAMTLRPHYPETRRLLALAYCVIGEREKAVLLCEEWVKKEPDDALARHTLAACSGRDVPPRASDAYIEKVFDNFAASFEVKLTQLRYQAPALVAAALADVAGPAAKQFDILDAGCGTGLCGPLVAPYARRLTGVDLSAGMIKHAREKDVYNELVRGELTEYLRGCRGAFDVIVSADTLVYFGALDDFAIAAAGALRPDGLLVFTVEELVDDAGVAPYCIKPHGRFNHRADYVDRLFREVGMAPTITGAELRLESGLPVAGLIVRARKPASATREHHA